MYGFCSPPAAGPPCGGRASDNVSDATINAMIKVLHIRLEPSDSLSAGEMDAMLAAAPPGVDTCGDVYRGLARLCLALDTPQLARRAIAGVRPHAESRASGEEAPRAVIVCMDGLSPAELEFFSIVPRICRGVKVYVYGGPRSKTQIGRAIELGATGRATEDVVRTLADSDRLPLRSTRARVPGPAEATALRPPFAGETTGRSDAASPEPLVVSAESVTETPGGEPPAAAAEDEHEVSAGEDASSDTVRVPWLRYDDAPVRTAPRHRELWPDEVNARVPAKPRSSSHEPLLTEAELRALIGDDVPAVPPEENDAGEPGERENGERLT